MIAPRYSFATTTPKWRTGLVVFLFAIVGGLFIAKVGILGGLLLLILPLAVATTTVVFRQPENGLYLTMIAAFVGAGLSRYVAGPTGLLVDAGLALTLVAVLLQFRSLPAPGHLRNGLVAVVVIWFLYNVFELFNPERPSVVAWFYAVRGVALYWLLAIPLAILLFHSRKHLDRVIFGWLLLSLAGTLWGLKQQLFGLDAAEQAWLSVPGNMSTHMLFGKLRVFSFYSDSGQFGASQGHAAVLAGILALGRVTKSKKILLVFIASASIYGLLISGTRGAMAVPFIGFLVYLILSKNWKILGVGILLIVSTFAVLKYTHIGHDVYEIRRMRTAVIEGSDNASLQVRMINQERLGKYLEGRPFGGGVGSAGYWGLRFSPDTFLANLALDSWYVKIWAEQGVVGLSLYLLILVYVTIACYRKISRVTDPELRQKLLALFCGFLGIVAASYGNQVMGQMPTGILVAYSLALIFIAGDTSRNEKDLPKDES